MQTNDQPFAESGRMVRFHTRTVGRFYLVADNVLPADQARFDGFPVYRASELADLLPIHPALRALAGCADTATTEAVRLIHTTKTL